MTTEKKALNLRSLEVLQRSELGCANVRLSAGLCLRVDVSRK